ncbi:MAG: UDP-N-acetylmuramate--L-alanine ligase, partial [Deinococcus sp.]|nr:UDP-N-acetylmuramate--L-alanine ligase [Deinococcus sp.]
THGKTTTTAMTALALLGAGRDPAALIGGQVRELGGNYRPGTGPLVYELDESDRLFPLLHPQVAVLTNLEADHIAGGPVDRPNYYHTLEELFATCCRFVQELPPEGLLVYCADWPALDSIVQHAPGRTLSYGLTARARLQAQQRRSSLPQRAQVVLDGQELGIIELPVPGEHNLSNALGALAAASALGAEFAPAAQALASFRGAGRRLEKIGEAKGIAVYDDYAHHPTAVRVTLEAAREWRRPIKLVFQPHRYLRTKELYLEFAQAVAAADGVILLDIYAAGEAPIAGVSARLILEALPLGTRAFYAGTIEAAVAYLARTVQDHDLVLTMGAGDVSLVGQRLLEVLK